MSFNKNVLSIVVTFISRFHDLFGLTALVPLIFSLNRSYRMKWYVNYKKIIIPYGVRHGKGDARLDCQGKRKKI